MAERRHKRTWWWLYTAGVVAALVYLGGGYGAGWVWTGLSRRVTLWDWLEGLALPVTVGLIPLLVRRRGHTRTGHKAIGVIVLLIFAALVLFGYFVPWRWTGFTGNTLWDWLSLALLPVVIAASTVWRSPRRWRVEHVLVLMLAVFNAVALVVAGYLVPWTWTGFTRNTAWDWIKLLLLPVLIPTVVLPRLIKSAESWLSPQPQAEDR